MPCNSDSAAPPRLERPEQEQIRAQVDRVLNSSLFRSSHRCQVLLRHVAECALAGETDNLKERTLGIDVFGRAPDYDTNSDPVVRGTAGEIRKKLAQYYQDPEHAGELRIELNRGGYVPSFTPHYSRLRRLPGRGPGTLPLLLALSP